MSPGEATFHEMQAIKQNRYTLPQGETPRNWEYMSLNDKAIYIRTNGKFLDDKNPSLREWAAKS